MRRLSRAAGARLAAGLAALAVCGWLGCSSEPLDPRAVERVERSRRQELVQECWLPAFHARPDVGELGVPLSFSISPDGVPQDVQVDRTGGVPEAFAECVRAHVVDWRYPSSGGGAPRATRTLHFQSQPDIPPSLTW